MDEVKAAYDHSLWSEHQQLLDQFSGKVKDISRQISSVEAGYQPTEQKYAACKEELEQVFSQLDQFEDTAERIKGLKPKLDQKFDKWFQQLRALQKRYNVTVQKIQDEKLMPAPRIQQRGREADKALTSAEAAVNAVPRKLNELDKCIDQAERAVNRLDIVFEKVQEEKANAEEMLEELERSYSKMKGQLGWLKSAEYTSDFKQIRESASEALLALNFEEVSRYVNKGHFLVGEMEDKFEENEEELRRKLVVSQREFRQPDLSFGGPFSGQESRSSADNRSSSSGGDSSFGQNSQGGSTDYGSGSSGGDSNYGSGSSGGDSNFGGGSSGGSSKW
ncbi:hypothetical protein [Paenibacillus caui]|uniref:hypothetical protein n=1 Tax=Paenibacillus caui TaxID=2873927 RepID=UPI001CA8A04B|nr:hypothetical protein [Paenibacillus caui]